MGFKPISDLSFFCPIIFLGIALSFGVQGQHTGDSNHKVKLVYIWSFTSHIRPEHPNPDKKDYIICYLGQDSVFFQELKRLEERKVDFTKPTKVLWNGTTEQQLNADMLILGEKNEADLKLKIRPFLQASVVTVSMLSKPAKSLASANLFSDGSNIKFCINKEACDAASLIVGNELLNLAQCK
jgi:hypothetical protein